MHTQMQRDTTKNYNSVITKHELGCQPSATGLFVFVTYLLRELTQANSSSALL